MELSSDPVESGPEFAGLNKIFSIDIDGLLPGTTYYYWIVAKNSFGSSQSVVQSFTTTSSGNCSNIAFIAHITFVLLPHTTLYSRKPKAASVILRL